MASSIYIYPNFNEYIRFYGREQNDLTYEAVLIDLYVDVVKQKLFVITNTSNEKERILNQYRERSKGKPDSELEINATNRRIMGRLDKAISKL